MTITHEHQDTTSTLLSDIISLGSARLIELEHGGVLMASFGDWAWATGQPLSLQTFDFWLATMHEHPNPPAHHVSRARTYLNHLSTGVTQ